MLAAKKAYRNGWVAFGLGIASILLCLGPFTGIPAIIYGNRARRGAPAWRSEAGTLGVIGVSLSIVATVLWFLAFIAFMLLLWYTRDSFDSAA
jgi:hypothetical protein